MYPERKAEINRALRLRSEANSAIKKNLATMAMFAATATGAFAMHEYIVGGILTTGALVMLVSALDHQEQKGKNF